MEVTDKQMKQLGKYIKKHPKTIFNTVFGMALMKKDAAAAEELLYRYVKSAPYDSTANVVLGKINEDKNNLSNAELFYKKALKISPENIYGRVGLLRVLWEQGKKDEYKNEYKHFLSEPDIVIEKLLQSLPSDDTMGGEEATESAVKSEKPEIESNADIEEETYEIEASIGLAKLYYEQGFHKDAVLMLRKLIGDDNNEARKLLDQWEEEK